MRLAQLSPVRALLKQVPGWVLAVAASGAMLPGLAMAQSPDLTSLKDGSLPPDFAVCEGDFDERPLVTRISRPTPPQDMYWGYAQFALRHDMYWEVVVTFDLDDKGRPRNISSSATDPAMIAKAANSTLAAWRFRPAMRDGKAVSAHCRTLFEYDLRTSKMKQEQAARNARAPRQLTDSPP